MRTEAAAVEETLDTDERAVLIEPDAPSAVLRDPAPVKAAPEGDLRDVKRRHLAFKQAGRASDLGLPGAGETIPLPLFPYLEFDQLRGDYPICVFKDPQHAPAPLSRVIDESLSASGLVGDDLERCRRWALQLETRMRRIGLKEADHRLFALWNKCSEELSRQHGDDPGKQTRLHGDLAALRKHITSDAILVGCDGQTASRILDAVSREKDSRDLSSTVNEIRAAVRKLSDLLALEDEESDAGLDPAHLRDAVGEGFQADLDFEALSSILHDAPHAESLTPSRRTRIETIVEILSQYLDGIEKRGRSLVSLTESVGIRESVQKLLVEEDLSGRAWIAARLELSGRFDDLRHGALLDPAAATLWGQTLSTSTPLPPIHLVAPNGLSGSDLTNLQELFDRGIPVLVMVSVGNCVADDRSGNAEPYLPASAGERLLLSSPVDGFLCQRSLGDVDGLLQAMKTFLACDSTGVLIVYDGANFGEDRLHPYLKSAAGADARVVPSFAYDTRDGSTWAERFSLDGNEQIDHVWPVGKVDVTTADGGIATRETAFNAASLMLCEPAFTDHFALIDAGEWHDDLVPIEEYSGDAHLVPYVTAASMDGLIHRVICSDHVWRQAARVAARWTSLRELGGIENSHAVKAVAEAAQRLEAEHQDRLSVIEGEHQSVLAATTGKLAEEIVANIAAGLLGEASTGPLPVTRRRHSPEPPPLERQEEDLQGAPESVAAPAEVEDDGLEILDEAYVETPRCTACDECTTLNPRLFAYNENKQAYIADLTAGTFRELVLAAEKCPVRIIHPGKPLNPDEPHLDELVKRAEPFR